MGRAKKGDSISTFLGADVNVEGTIEFKGTIRLDGNVKGRICSDGGTVIVGENAVIMADVVVDKAIIMGEVQGTINAKERIEVYHPGRVKGDIQAPVISIDAGVMFNGKCSMKPRTIDHREDVEKSPKPVLVKDSSEN
ncbi:MAG: polymer-forming cytoskeletal protein [Desulfobacterales bacterium]|nr:polymer-forming cytoskeletal protein [Desulfobacterales bacterium]